MRARADKNEPQPNAQTTTQPAPAVTHANLGRVIFWMTGALLSFCAMAVSVRALASTLSIAEILTIRSGSGALALTALVAARPELRHTLAMRRMGLHLLRNAVHFAAQYSWALSVTLLPLATVFALEFTAPAWVALLAIPLLKERMTVIRAASIGLGFVGVLIIVRPGLESFRPAVLIVLVAAVGFAVSLIVTKKLTATVGTFAILFWMNWMQLPMGLLASDPLFPLRLDATHLPAVAAVAVAGLSSHLCLTNAFRAGEATLVVPFDFLRIPLIALVGWFIYDEALDWLVFAGAAVIIAGILWNLGAETRR
jgi:drug/metabolite transporter (DMT)-like permease